LSNDNKRITSNEPIIAQSKDKKQALSTENPASNPRLFLPQTLIGFKRGEKPCKLKQRKVNRAGHEIAPNTVANATKIIALATKIQKLVAKLATRIL